jgi:hypothetical protein
MSLPNFSTQQSLFGVGSLADNLFPTTNRFRLFAEKVWPLLTQARPALETMYCADNGRPAAEPVVLAGVCLLQFLERVPDRAAMELLTMHLGWKRALQRDLDAAAYDPNGIRVTSPHSTLVCDIRALAKLQFGGYHYLQDRRRHQDDHDQAARQPEPAVFDQQRHHPGGVVRRLPLQQSQPAHQTHRCRRLLLGLRL